MSNSTCTVRVKTFQNDRWGDLCALGNRRVEVVAERYKVTEENFSFIGGHRVRKLNLWDNVHFKLAAGINLDITEVRPIAAPTRPAVTRHDKRQR